MGDPLERLGSEAIGLESSIKDDLSMEIDPPFKENTATADDWRKALSKVVPAVVVLRTTACRAFDTEAAGASYATGFVVDKCRGIILTNRHVVKPGPVVAEAMFVNREEVPVYPIYRDPVHDFGFFCYDPGTIQFLNYEEIPLAPEAACVGLEIRVVGNDSGEKVSILAGTIARLDRDAPHYKKDGYNDFNTFYMQAASGTKGGSSGSPVVDWLGRAVALNAGSKSSSASAFFLPLERVVRALKFLQKGRDSFVNKWEAVSIPRGTLQVTFVHKGFDETRRLGLQSETEQLVRHASPLGETGMLVVENVVPGGPAYKCLEPGDVLVCMNGEVITQFLKLETLLDDSVNQKIEMQIERGGKPLTVDLVVQDLHSITPNYFLEVSGAVIHPLSYQQARNFRFHCGLVYVSEPGYMLFRAGVPRHAIIKKFAGEEISRLEDLISGLCKLSRGARVPLEYISYMDRHRRKSVLVTVDRHEWYAPPQIYTRDDCTGLWTAKPAFQPDAILLSSGINGLGGRGSQAGPLSSEVISVGHIHHDSHEELTDGVASMETSYEHASEGAHSRDEFDAGTKKRRVKENFSSDGSVVADCSFPETNEGNLEDPNTMENAVMGDFQAANVATANASLAERAIEPTLVMLEVHVPPSCMLDGVHSQHFFGTGVIIYHSQNMGLVAVDKNTVAISASDVMLSFAAFPIEIPGEVVFLHPVHNYALISYDPLALGAIGTSVVRAAELLPDPALRRGDSVYLVGLSRSLQATSRKSTVTNPCAALNIGSADCPRYRATNMEVIELDTDFGSTFSGVLTDEHGRVQAIWGSFSTQVYTVSLSKRKRTSKNKSSSSEDHQFVRGIPIYAISQVLEKIISGAQGPPLLINRVKRPMPLVRILEVELYPTLLSKARSFGLSDDWVQALVKKDPIRRQVLRVKGCLAGSKAENLLEQGDMVLAINKEPVTCFRDVENVCQALDKNENKDGKLDMTIFRQGREIDLLVGTDVRDGSGTTRVVNWCGCIVQDPHPAVRALGFLPEEGHGVYVARWCHGSPVHRYGLYALQWIVEVNGKQTPDLDAFVNVTKELEHGQFVRVRTVHLNGKPRVLTLKQDLHYWPTWELRFDPDSAMWYRKTIKALDYTGI
ncbi:protease Do-like 7 isoform X1 [Prunus dulcis]|uniref:protease Do-like 7 isoform X1 n=2 Tax=Prunus dulcis TaxID=3755 RepID=UPI001483B01D|nr:protease Do-like 7 isoform X1 [Prunus dulcis]